MCRPHGDYVEEGVVAVSVPCKLGTLPCEVQLPSPGTLMVWWTKRVCAASAGGCDARQTRGQRRRGYGPRPVAAVGDQQGSLDSMVAKVITWNLGWLRGPPAGVT